MTIVKKVKKVKKVMANYEDLFSFSAADALAETESKKTTFVGSTYKPSISDEKCVDFNYRALVRFLPFVHEGKIKTTIERWECFLKDINGENGIFVKDHDVDSIVEAIKRLSEDRTLLRKLGEEARKTIFSQFSPKKYIEKLNDIYLRLC